MQIQLHLQQLSEEYCKQQFQQNTMKQCITNMQQYLKQEKNEDQFLINNGGIKLITPTQWVFEKCYSIYVTFNPYGDGTLFQFSSSYLDGKRIIANGVHCYILAGVIFYKIVYQRFSLEKVLVEDYSSNHKLCDVLLHKWNELIIQHECGKLYSRTKFNYSLNQNKYNLHVDYPKIKNTNLEFLYFQNIQCKVKEISIYNEIGDLTHKQPYYQIYPIFSNISKKIKDRVQNVVYELQGNTIQTSALQKFDFVEFGGIKILVPLFELVQFYDASQIEELFEIILYVLLQDSPINKQQILSLKLFQQIAQIIKVDINNLHQILLIKQKIDDQDILNQLLLMIIDINFINRVTDQHQYCILLQQFYFNDHHKYLKVTSIQYLAQILVSANHKPIIQDQILQVMIYVCQYNFQTLKEQFKLFLKIAEASTIELKVKAIQSAYRLIADLSRDDFENFIIFRDHNIQQKILYDILLLLQTDSIDVIVATIQLLGSILKGTQDILTKGIILYVSKAIDLKQQEEIEPLLQALPQLLTLSPNSIDILQNLFQKTKSEKILDYYFNFIQKTDPKNQEQILKQNSIWLLDQLLIQKNAKILDIYLTLLQKQPQQLSLLLIEYQIRNNIELVMYVVEEAVLRFTEEQTFQASKILFQIFVSVCSFKNFEIFLTKLIKFTIYVENEQQLSQVIEEKALIFLLKKILNGGCSCTVLKEWLFYLSKLFEQIQYLNTVDSETIMNQIVELLHNLHDQTQDTQIKDAIQYFLHQNELILQSLSNLQQQQLFNSIQYQEDFNDNLETLLNKWTQEEQLVKIQQSEQLAQLTDEISIAAGCMQVSVYKLINKTRKLRQMWHKLWHNLRITTYKPLNCEFQIDQKIDQSYIFQENPYYINKIDKNINRLYSKPIIKMKFKVNTKFEDDVKVPLNKSEKYQCFWLKQLYLKQGGISIGEEKITFSYYSYTEPANHITLLSHTIPNHKPFKRSWKKSQIRWVYERIYIRNRNALEIIFKDGESLYLIFQGLGQKEEILEKLNKVTKECEFNKVSNFKYLMYLNFLSCRSYIDLTRYPVFPWVLKGNASDFDDNDIGSIQNEINYRDLSLPIGACGTEKRLDQFIKRFENEQFYYGTHYSSQALVSQYLLRLSPFTEAAISIQDGKFDIPDRLFRSIMKSWMDCNEEMADVRELVPEFFYLPEAFLNVNGYNLGNLQNGAKVNNILLPFYSNNNPFYFVAQNMIALESPFAVKLNEWIDLIWGYKQQGQYAVDSFNVFYPLTYSNFDENNFEINELAMETQIAHFGQTPEQLFYKPHPQKDLDYHPYAQYNSQLKQKKAQSKVVYLICNKNKLISFHEEFTCSIYKWVIINNKNVNQNQFNLEKIVQLQKFSFDAMIKFNKWPICIFIDLLIIIFGGINNGTLQYNCLENPKLQGVIELNNSIIQNYQTVTTIESNKSQSILICGTNNGFIYYYEKVLENKSQLTLEELLSQKHIIYDTKECINTLAISEELNIFCVGTNNGCVFIYNLYNRILYRYIQHPKQMPIQYLTLSYSPLPVILFSSHDDRILAYSINGFLLQILQVKESVDYMEVKKSSINSLIVITDQNIYEYRLPFLDRLSKIANQVSNGSRLLQFGKQFIIYGTKQGELHIQGLQNI